MSETAPENMGGNEQVESFIPTPEKVSEYMGPDFKIDEIHGEFKSAEGRQRIFEQIMVNEEQIRAVDPNFDPEKVRMQLDAVGEALTAEEKFFKQEKLPESKGMFARAWESITSFPRKHKVLTAIFLIAVLAGMAINLGWINGLGFGSGMGNWFGGAAAAEGAAAGEGAVAAEAGAEAVAAEGAAGAAEAAPTVDALNAAAVEAAQQKLIPQSIDLFMVDHSIIYNGQTFTFDEFKNVFPDIVKDQGDKILTIIRDKSARVTTENSLRTFLDEVGLQGSQYKWTNNFGAIDD